MFIDLDNFKTVNDTLGHDTGDELLRLVSKRLSSTLRFGDVLCRIGGDEFAIILENVAQASVASMIAEKCLASLAHPMSIDGNAIHVSASIGISTYPDDAKDVHELLKYADTAMYYAKNSGKNAYRIFVRTMQGEAQKRFTMDNNLRRALERDEFKLHYQPQIDLNTGSITGVEALLRWVHPELGMINPADFIPIAEDTGLIVPIGNWVLREACRQMKQWHDEGMDQLCVAINLSGRQLKEPDFVASVLQAVAETGISPKRVELELTESMLMDAESTIVDKLYALRSEGIELTIDDFGTGYSSMSYLKTFPINCLKIDRTFVRDLPHNREDAAITRAIIALAKTLKMHVVAEGIENAEQGQFLRASGCHKSQGYFYSKPLPADQVRTLLVNRVGWANQAKLSMAGPA
jgi:diguanylate cyclase (GGDEF)-like protein